MDPYVPSFLSWPLNDLVSLSLYLVVAHGIWSFQRMCNLLACGEQTSSSCLPRATRPWTRDLPDSRADAGLQRKADSAVRLDPSEPRATEAARMLKNTNIRQLYHVPLPHGERIVQQGWPRLGARVANLSTLWSNWCLHLCWRQA